jgi:hypothetical protein
MRSAVDSKSRNLLLEGDTVAFTHGVGEAGVFGNRQVTRALMRNF